MKGAIAAGSESTAAAGAEILEAGGNAVDAAVAACLATSAGEPTLTSLGGAGALLYHPADTGRSVLCDFFADAPGLAADQPVDKDFFAVELDFGPTTQRFHIGAASGAIPGAIPGLCAALERWGSLPLSEVVRPASRMLRQGVNMGHWQARAAKLLEPILLHSATGRRLFQRGDRMVQAGELFQNIELADTLDAMADQGWRAHYDQVIVPAVLEQFGPGGGGLITADDLAAYRVRYRDPLALDYRGVAVRTNPPPATGGRMIALMLALLQSDQLDQLQRGGQRLIHALSRAMAVADSARGGLDDLDQQNIARLRRRYHQLADQPLQAAAAAPSGPGSTTHVSVIDAAGNAAAVTFSYGEGNGYFIGSTGIMMNNLMGEEDLFPDGFHRWPAGERLSTMMSPTLALDSEGGAVAMGSGGANRIRSALVQVISNLFDHQLPAQEAVTAARVHFEQGVLNAEIYDMAHGGQALDQLGAPQVVRFDEPNLFFGGVHLVRRHADGRLEGAGDPRRGGVSLVV